MYSLPPVWVTSTSNLPSWMMTAHHGPELQESCAALGWAVKHVYLCEQESAWWIAHLLRKKFMYLFNKYLLNAYCVLATYARLSGQSCEQQRHCPCPSRVKHLNSSRGNSRNIFLLFCQSLKHRFKRHIQSYLSKDQQVWFGSLWNSTERYLA